MDNPIENTQCQDGDELVESERDRQHFDKEFMKAYIEDLKERGWLLICKIILNEYTKFHSLINAFIAISQADKKLIGEEQVTL